MHSPQCELLYVLGDMLCQLVCTVDQDGRLSYCNPAWKAVTRANTGASFAESLLPAFAL